jgi:hypothetical protein
MFITAEEVQAKTSFDEVKQLEPSVIESYLDRADSWIRRATNRVDLPATLDPVIQQDLRVATLLLVEYIWFWDNPEMKEQAISHDDVVRLGSYTFNIDKARPGDKTGHDELDGILESLKFTPKIGHIFRVSNKGET